MQKLSRLTLRTLDEISHISGLQQLIEIALEQGEQPLESRISRIELLIEVYRCQMESHLHEMQAAIEGIRSEIAAAAPSGDEAI